MCLLDVISLVSGVIVNVNGHCVSKVGFVRKSCCVVIMVKEVNLNVSIVVFRPQ